MKRPEQNDDRYYPFSIKENMEWYIDDIEAYCDLLEQTISAIRDDHSELMQNYTDCVRHNEELKNSHNLPHTNHKYYSGKCVICGKMETTSCS